MDIQKLTGEVREEMQQQNVERAKKEIKGLIRYIVSAQSSIGNLQKDIKEYQKQIKETMVEEIPELDI